MKNLILLFVLSFTIPLFATPNKWSKFKTIDISKKVKVRLHNNSSFNGYVVKIEGSLLYTVKSKKEKRAALHNNCINCKVTPISNINKISRKGLIWGIILGMVGIGVALFLAWAAAVSSPPSSGGDNIFSKTLTKTALISTPIGFLLGYYIGSELEK